MKKKEYVPYLLIVIFVILLRTFIITPVIVNGPSMRPTLENGEVLILKKYDTKIARFEIVVIKYNNDKLVKRVIGLPGETIKYEDNKLYVNNKLIEETFIHGSTMNFETTVPKGAYFVLGDNRTNSTDSRSIGPVYKKSIIGTTNLSIFPFNKIGIIK